MNEKTSNLLLVNDFSRFFSLIEPILTDIKQYSEKDKNKFVLGNLELSNLIKKHSELLSKAVILCNSNAFDTDINKYLNMENLLVKLIEDFNNFVLKYGNNVKKNIFKELCCFYLPIYIYFSDSINYCNKDKEIKSTLDDCFYCLTEYINSIDSSVSISCFTDHIPKLNSVVDVVRDYCTLSRNDSIMKYNYALDSLIEALRSGEGYHTKDNLRKIYSSISRVNLLTLQLYNTSFNQKSISDLFESNIDLQSEDGPWKRIISKYGDCNSFINIIKTMLSDLSQILNDSVQIYNLEESFLHIKDSVNAINKHILSINFPMRVLYVDGKQKMSFARASFKVVKMFLVSFIGENTLFKDFVTKIEGYMKDFSGLGEISDMKWSGVQCDLDEKEKFTQRIRDIFDSVPSQKTILELENIIKNHSLELHHQHDKLLSFIVYSDSKKLLSLSDEYIQTNRNLDEILENSGKMCNFIDKILKSNSFNEVITSNLKLLKGVFSLFITANKSPDFDKSAYVKLFCDYLPSDNEFLNLLDIESYVNKIHSKISSFSKNKLTATSEKDLLDSIENKSSQVSYFISDLVKPAIYSFNALNCYKTIIEKLSISNSSKFNLNLDRDSVKFIDPLLQLVVSGSFVPHNIHDFFLHMIQLLLDDFNREKLKKFAVPNFDVTECLHGILYNFYSLYSFFMTINDSEESYDFLTAFKGKIDSVLLGNDFELEDILFQVEQFQKKYYLNTKSSKYIISSFSHEFCRSITMLYNYRQLIYSLFPDISLRIYVKSLKVNYMRMAIRQCTLINDEKIKSLLDGVKISDLIISQDTESFMSVFASIKNHITYSNYNFIDQHLYTMIYGISNHMDSLELTPDALNSLQELHRVHSGICGSDHRYTYSDTLILLHIFYSLQNDILFDYDFLSIKETLEKLSSRLLSEIILDLMLSLDCTFIDFESISKLEIIPNVFRVNDYILNFSDKKSTPIINGLKSLYNIINSKSEPSTIKNGIKVNIEDIDNYIKTICEFENTLKSTCKNNLYIDNELQKDSNNIKQMSVNLNTKYEELKSSMDDFHNVLSQINLLHINEFKKLQDLKKDTYVLTVEQADDLSNIESLNKLLDSLVPKSDGSSNVTNDKFSRETSRSYAEYHQEIVDRFLEVSKENFRILDQICYEYRNNGMNLQDQLSIISTKSKEIKLFETNQAATEKDYRSLKNMIYEMDSSIRVLTKKKEELRRQIENPSEHKTSEHYLSFLKKNRELIDKPNATSFQKLLKPTLTDAEAKLKLKNDLLQELDDIRNSVK